MNSMWLSVCCCLWFSLLSGMADADQINSDSTVLILKIRQVGAAAVIHDLHESGEWDSLMQRISSGDKASIDIALLLGKGSDAGSTEELRDALFLALSKNPAYVLLVLSLDDNSDASFALSHVCKGRTDPPNTYMMAITELQEAEKAVRNIKTRALHSRRQLCLTKLADGEKDAQRFFQTR